MSSKQKHIAIILPFFTLGGAETQALYIAESFLNSGNKVTVIAFETRNSQLIDKLVEKNVSYKLIDLNLSAIHTKGFEKFLMLYKYLKALRKLKIDYLFPLTYYPNVLTSAVWRFCGAKMCFWNQRGMERISVNFIEKIAVKMKPNYLANAKTCAEFIAKRHNFNVNKVSVIPNAVTHKKVNNEKKSLIKKSQGETIFLSIANFYPEKNHEDIINAWALFEKQRGDKLNEKLILIGYFPNQANEHRIKALLYDAGCKNIILFPPSDNIMSLYEAADVGIIASYSEGCPNVLLEYMQQELTVLSSNIGSTIEILGNEYPYMFNIGDFNKLSQLLNNALEMNSKSVINKNKSLINNKYTFSNLSDSYNKLI